MKFTIDCKVSRTSTHQLSVFYLGGVRIRLLSLAEVGKLFRLYLGEKIHQLDFVRMVIECTFGHASIVERIYACGLF